MANNSPKDKLSARVIVGAAPDLTEHRAENYALEVVRKLLDSSTPLDFLKVAKAVKFVGPECAGTSFPGMMYAPERRFDDAVPELPKGLTARFNLRACFPLSNTEVLEAFYLRHEGLVVNDLVELSRKALAELPGPGLIDAEKYLAEKDPNARLKYFGEREFHYLILPKGGVIGLDLEILKHSNVHIHDSGQGGWSNQCTLRAETAERRFKIFPGATSIRFETRERWLDLTAKSFEIGAKPFKHTVYPHNARDTSQSYELELSCSKKDGMRLVYVGNFGPGETAISIEPRNLLVAAKI